MVMGRRRHVSGGHGAGEGSAVRLPPTATRTSNGPTHPCQGTTVGRDSVKKTHKRPRAGRWWQDGTKPPRRQQAPGRAERATGGGIGASSACPIATTTGQLCQRRPVTSKKKKCTPRGLWHGNTGEGRSGVPVPTSQPPRSGLAGGLHFSIPQADRRKAPARAV